MAKCSTDHVREVIRTYHISYSTEKIYVGWLYRFIIFHNQRHPKDIDFELDEIIIRGWYRFIPFGGTVKERY